MEQIIQRAEVKQNSTGISDEADRRTMCITFKEGLYTTRFKVSKQKQVHDTEIYMYTAAAAAAAVL